MVQFARDINMEPIEAKKEAAGQYRLNCCSFLLNAASALWVNGVADVETIDKTWRLGTGAPMGPFQIFDVIGMVTPYNIAKASDDPNAALGSRRSRDGLHRQGQARCRVGGGFRTADGG